MPRIARIIIPEFPYHVVQRGNNKQPIFLDNDDRKTYIDLAKWYCAKWSCSVFAYSLMPNHVHLLLKPSTKIGVAKAMQGISLCHTQNINKKYHRTGRLWESRYYSSIVSKDLFFWHVVRYIDWNSVRAGLAESPQEYPWSSARAHMLGIEDPLTRLEDLYEFINFEEGKSFLEQEGSKEESAMIWRATRKGLPLGDENFQKDIERKSGKKLIPGARGRPRKENKK